MVKDKLALQTPPFLPSLFPQGKREVMCSSHDIQKCMCQSYNLLGTLHSREERKHTFFKKQIFSLLLLLLLL